MLPGLSPWGGGFCESWNYFSESVSSHLRHWLYSSSFHSLNIDWLTATCVTEATWDSSRQRNLPSSSHEKEHSRWASDEVKCACASYQHHEGKGESELFWNYWAMLQRKCHRYDGVIILIVNLTQLERGTLHIGFIRLAYGRGIFLTVKWLKEARSIIGSTPSKPVWERCLNVRLGASHSSMISTLVLAWVLSWIHWMMTVIYRLKQIRPLIVES